MSRVPPRHRLPEPLRDLVRHVATRSGGERMAVSDEQLEEVLVSATTLIWAVREMAPETVQECFTEAQKVITDPTAAAQALAVVLAAMVSDDAAPSELLAWLADPDECLRLRSNGVDGVTATALVSRGGSVRGV